MKKKLTIGILAHVDAGKTTLSEALLYVSGKIRRQGRVDHGDTYLDTNAVERERGITVFSKQARFSYRECDFILLDTPGHVDFSAETERTLALLDYAVLLVSAPDGVQNHTRTLWNLLEFYGVPTFIFVNKTDICIKTKKELEEELCRALSPNCVAFFENQTKAELDEKLALLNEELLEAFLAEEPVAESDIAELISERALFPCLFGSALRNTGVEFLLETLEKYTFMPAYGEKFGAKVYKIAYTGGTRLTYMKITGGTLRARDELAYTAQNGEKLSEKVSFLRLYSGEKFEQAETAAAGEICAVAGLSATYAGLGFGEETGGEKPVLAPVLSYRIVLPDGCDTGVYYMKLKELEEEEPSLHLRINEELGEIEAELMGEIGAELLARRIHERFGIKCEFDEGKILYKEKISEKALGIGHFEPLRHYAEVQLLMEPLPSGMGLIIDANVPENTLAQNWQRLILSHLYEKAHRGTLVGAELTDTKITLVAGKAHQKHTEGGDFREATLRAVRCGLMRGGCTLLEPYYKFRLEVPGENVGRAMADLQARSAEFSLEEADGEFTTLCGRAPVAALRGYVREVIAYTRGKGKLSCTSDGYEPCENEAEVAAEFAYDPEADVENTPHSVFCAGGAGFIVPWQEVEEYKHLDANYVLAPEGQTVMPKPAVIAKKYRLGEDELEKIMFRLFGDGSPRKAGGKRVVSAEKAEKPKKKAAKPMRHMIIVDGYNVIYAWESLKAIAAENLEDARKTLMDILSNYVAFTKKELVLVFDAYRVKDGRGSDFSHDGFRVVFTKQDETADAYIEKMMHELGPDYSIRTVTGDRLVQFAAVHSGVLRMTPGEFEAEVTRVGTEINDFLKKLEENR